MKLMFWKNNFLIDNFAKKLADDFFSLVQPEQLAAFFASREDNAAPAAPAKGKGTKAKGGAAQAVAVTERAMQDTAHKIAQFKQQEKLGIYGKARLHLSFTERLEELGFDKASTQRLNRILLLQTA